MAVRVDGRRTRTDARLCVCGCQRADHRHYTHHGSHCAQCGRGGCRRFRRRDINWLEAGLAAVGIIATLYGVVFLAEMLRSLP